MFVRETQSFYAELTHRYSLTFVTAVITLKKKHLKFALFSPIAAKLITEATTCHKISITYMERKLCIKGVNRDQFLQGQATCVPQC